MIKVIHFSDLHIGESKNLEECKNLEKIREYLISFYQNSKNKPYIIISGDLVHHGEEKEYQKVVELLQPLVDQKFKLLISPGNHDLGRGGSVKSYLAVQEECANRYVKYIHKKLLKFPLDSQGEVLKYDDVFPLKTEILQGNDKLLLIGLNSMEKIYHKPLRFATGKIPKKDLKTLAHILEDSNYKSHKKIVYLHHHLFSNRAFMVLKKRKKVRQFLNKNRVDLVLFGHLHKECDCKSGSYLTKYLASGKTTKLTKNKKISFKEIQIEDNKINIVQKSITL